MEFKSLEGPHPLLTRIEATIDNERGVEQSVINSYLSQVKELLTVCEMAHDAPDSLMYEEIQNLFGAINELEKIFKVCGNMCVEDDVIDNSLLCLGQILVATKNIELKRCILASLAMGIDVINDVSILANESFINELDLCRRDENEHASNDAFYVLSRLAVSKEIIHAFSDFSFWWEVISDCSNVEMKSDLLGGISHYMQIPCDAYEVVLETILECIFASVDNPDDLDASSKALLGFIDQFMEFGDQIIFGKVKRIFNQNIENLFEILREHCSKPLVHIICNLINESLYDNIENSTMHLLEEFMEQAADEENEELMTQYFHIGARMIDNCMGEFCDEALAVAVHAAAVGSFKLKQASIEFISATYQRPEEISAESGLDADFATIIADLISAPAMDVIEQVLELFLLLLEHCRDHGSGFVQYLMEEYTDFEDVEARSEMFDTILENVNPKWQDKEKLEEYIESIQKILLDESPNPYCYSSEREDPEARMRDH